MIKTQATRFIVECCDRFHMARDKGATNTHTLNHIETEIVVRRIKVFQEFIQDQNSNTIYYFAQEVYIENCFLTTTTSLIRYPISIIEELGDESKVIFFLNFPNINFIGYGIIIELGDKFFHHFFIDNSLLVLSVLCRISVFPVVLYYLPLLFIGSHFLLLLLLIFHSRFPEVPT